jgi:hypothetical protein
MKLSNRQKAILHQAAAAAGHNRDQYLMVLQGVAGVRSSTDPAFSRDSFQRVMAFFEAENEGVLPGFTAGYWRAQVRQSDPGDSLRHACCAAGASMGWSPAQVDAFMASRQCSGGRFQSLRAAPIYWLSRCLDGLKAIRSRNAHSGNGEKSPTTAQGASGPADGVPVASIAPTAAGADAGGQGADSARDASPRHACYDQEVPF